jgi:hypothetical protein
VEVVVLIAAIRTTTADVVVDVRVVIVNIIAKYLVASHVHRLLGRGNTTTTTAYVNLVVHHMVLLIYLISFVGVVSSASESVVTLGGQMVLEHLVIVRLITLHKVSKSLGLRRETST